MYARFEWDPSKAASNLRKHGVSFQTAVLVFADPKALVVQDRVENGEERWQAIGVVAGHFTLVVAHTVREQDGTEVIRIISARLPTEGKRDAMKKKLVKHKIDLSHPPTLTATQKAELKALQAKPESDIDYSDIPPVPEDFWKKAVRNPFYRPTKTSTTVRIDSDVLRWLRAQGKGYQSRINAILRREMLASVNHTNKKQG